MVQVSHIQPSSFMLINSFSRMDHSSFSSFFCLFFFFLLQQFQFIYIHGNAKTKPETNSFKIRNRKSKCTPNFISSFFSFFFHALFHRFFSQQFQIIYTHGSRNSKSEIRIHTQHQDLESNSEFVECVHMHE